MRELFRSGVQIMVAFVAAILLAAPSAAAPLQAKRPPLAIYGAMTTFEIAPVLLAADRLYPGIAAVRMGGIGNLVGAAPVPGYGQAGAADVATNAETQLLRYSVDHPDLRVVMTVSEGLYRIVARRSAGITRLADLRGKRIATMPNTSSAYFLHRMLASAGMTEADVTIVPIMPLSDMASALAGKAVDAVTIWEPEVENAARAIGEDAIVFSGAGVYAELFNLNTTAAALADPVRRRRIVAFVRGVIEASHRISRNPSAAWPLVEKASGYSHEMVTRSWPHHAFPAKLAPNLLDVMTDEEAWLAAQAKRPPRSRAQLAALIDTSVIEEALRAPQPDRPQPDQ